MYTDWAVITVTTIDDKNIPSRRGQRLIQVQLILFITICDHDEEEYDDDDEKETRPVF